MDPTNAPFIEEVFSDDDDEDSSDDSNIVDPQLEEHRMRLFKYGASTNVQLFYFFLLNTRSDPFIAHHFGPLLQDLSSLVILLGSTPSPDRGIANFIKAVAKRMNIDDFDQLYAIYRNYTQRLNDVATEVLTNTDREGAAFLDKFTPMDNEETIAVAAKAASYGEVAREHHTIYTMEED